MKIDGLQRMLDFLDFLRGTGTEFRIDQFSPDALTVCFALVGVRAEVEFSVDEMQYSLFKGKETVEVDEKALIDLIKELSK